MFYANFYFSFSSYDKKSLNYVISILRIPLICLSLAKIQIDISGINYGRFNWLISKNILISLNLYESIIKLILEQIEFTWKFACTGK